MLCLEKVQHLEVNLLLLLLLTEYILIFFIYISLLFLSYLLAF